MHESWTSGNERPGLVNIFPNWPHVTFFSRAMDFSSHSTVMPVRRKWDVGSTCRFGKTVHRLFLTANLFLLSGGFLRKIQIIEEQRKPPGRRKGRWRLRETGTCPALPKRENVRRFRWTTFRSTTRIKSFSVAYYGRVVDCWKVIHRLLPLEISLNRALYLL